MKQLGNESLPSVINNPFLKDKITSISIFYSCSIFDNNKWDCRGTVQFTNGSTSGEQKFVGDTFDEVVLKIKAMIETLNNKQIYEKQ